MLLGRQRGDHRVDVGAEPRELVAGRRGSCARRAGPVRRPRAWRGRRRRRRARGGRAGGPPSSASTPRERRHEHGEERVVAGDEHELHEHADGDRQLRRGDGGEQRRTGGAAPPMRERPATMPCAAKTVAHAQRGEDQQRREAGGRAVDGGGERGGERGRRAGEGEAARSWREPVADAPHRLDVARQRRVGLRSSRAGGGCGR